MKQENSQKILNHPSFQKMARRKAFLGWSFSILMTVVYIVFILFIGFERDAVNVPVVEGEVTTWGIFVGMLMIVFAFVLTGIYVHKANGAFDKMTKEVIDEVGETL